jgi:hypothetical protein
MGDLDDKILENDISHFYMDQENHTRLDNQS